MDHGNYHQLRNDAMKRLLAVMISICAVLSAAQLPAQTTAGKKAAPSSKNLPEGYGSLKWGTLYGAARSGVMGKISYTDEKRQIISKDGDIEYLYGFFYKEVPTAAEEKPETAAKAPPEGRLFYVNVRFPYLALSDLNKKMQERYGASSGETLTNNQGALVWDAEKTAIILWVDQYEKKPFCRKITYVGKEIAKELNEYQKEIFSSTEIEILKRLAP